MARRTFFSFHYERDIWRSSQVRNSWVTKPDREDAGFWNATAWEEVKKKGDEEIKRWINKYLDGTSVTVVLIGKETNTRKWVIYEVQRSYEKGNGMLGIYIHKIKDSEGKADEKGSNSFGELGKDQNGKSIYFWQIYSTYDWVDDDGYNNLGDWIEKAAKDADR